MANNDKVDDGIDRSKWLSAALSEVALSRGRDYRGSFIESWLGQAILYGDAFTRQAEPYLPVDLQRDGRLLRERTDSILRSTLEVCVLSVDDVVGPRLDDGRNQYELTPSQEEAMWTGWFTSHFSDILCDTQFWYIVDALRKDIGLDAPPIA